MILTAKELTQKSFAPYGEVIEVSEQAEKLDINYGQTKRYNALAKVDVSDENGQGIISIFRSTPKESRTLSNKTTQLTIDCMERHPLASQAFFPLSACPYLIVVAPKGEFDETTLQVFIANKNQGVNYYKGTWHHYCLAIEQVSDFLVIDRQGLGNNCDEVNLSSPISINYELNNRSD